MAVGKVVVKISFEQQLDGGLLLSWRIDSARNANLLLQSVTLPPPHCLTALIPTTLIFWPFFYSSPFLFLDQNFILQPESVLAKFKPHSVRESLRFSPIFSTFSHFFLFYSMAKTNCFVCLEFVFECFSFISFIANKLVARWFALINPFHWNSYFAVGNPIQYDVMADSPHTFFSKTLFTNKFFMAVNLRTFWPTAFANFPKVRHFTIVFVSFPIISIILHSFFLLFRLICYYFFS